MIGNVLSDLHVVPMHHDPKRKLVGIHMDRYGYVASPLETQLGRFEVPCLEVHVRRRKPSCEDTVEDTVVTVKGGTRVLPIRTFSF